MTSQPSVSPLRQRMIDDMHMRQLSPKTQATYLRIVREFARFLGRSPDTATIEDLRSYQLHLVDHGTSPVSLNAAVARTAARVRVVRVCQTSLCRAQSRARVPLTLYAPRRDLQSTPGRFR